MSKALAFLTGLGTGYMSQSQKNKELERQAKIDAQNTELHDARMDEIRSGKADKQTLRDAGAERTAMSGTAVNAPQGQMLYKDPAQAEAQAEQERCWSGWTASSSRRSKGCTSRWRALAST